MPVSKLTLKETKIAHVGDIGADGDISMRVVLTKWLIENRRDLIKARKVKHSFHDLTQGKDFLLDKGRYDIVALHYLFGPPPNYSLLPGNEFLVSPHQNKENWRKRLLETGAEVIVTFGSFTEVSYFYLGDLPGYDVKTYKLPGVWSVYTKSVGS